MEKLDWNKLLSEVKRKDLAKENEGTGTKGYRTQTERDYDRILFASPTRRMADKTQVFPLEKNDSVRTRLTHSHEVSNLARSIGMGLAFNYPKQVFGEESDNLEVQRRVPAMLASVGLAHDIGNPPFGHQGEAAIAEWFNKAKESKNLDFDIHADFKKFDGNPHAFRLLTRLQILNDDFGLNLTCGTLAALIKYPSFSTSERKEGQYKKFGIFESEKKIVNDVWDQTGLMEGVRHPFAHVMEACDDIAYAVIDAEDIVKKQFASFNDLIEHLETHCDGDELIKYVVEESKKKHAEYKKEKLSSKELNEISMQIFRVYSIHQLITAVTESFVNDISRILNMEIDGNYELLKVSKGYNLAKALKDFDLRNGFKHKDVLELELRGHNHIAKTMDMFWDAIHLPETPFGKYAYSLISENYRRVYEKTEKEPYDKCQLLCDTISGMTDKHLIRVHNELISLLPHD